MATSTLPLWGQAWELVVTSATTAGFAQTTLTYKAWEPEALRITFDVLQAMNSSPFWYADIAVYNLTAQEAQNILLNATWVTLRAGFQAGPNQLAVIWDGPVFQTIYTREDVVDQRVTLHCVANPFVMDEIVSFAMGPYASQAQLMAKMAGVSYQQGTAGIVAQQRMAATQYPRGNTVFGGVSKYLAQIADSNFLQTWQNGSQAYISEVAGGSAEINLVYAPAFPPDANISSTDLPAGTTQSIIGTPQQTQQGVNFSVLLDPRLKVGLPPLVAQLVRTQIEFTVITPGINNELPTALSSDLTFFVAQVRHVGDTRGNDWRTEVTGWSTAYAQTLLGLFTP